MKIILAVLMLVGSLMAQKVSCNAVPVSFVSKYKITSGLETDMVYNVTPNNGFGETTVVAGSPFVGGRYERYIPQIAALLSKSQLGENFKAGITVSIGAVKLPGVIHFGERAGVFLKYAPGGSKTFSLALEAQWNNLTALMSNQGSVSAGANFKW